MLALSTHSHVTPATAIATAKPVAEAVPYLQSVISVAVGPRLFNQLSSGKLSAIVLPENSFTPAGRGIVINNAATGEHVKLQMGSSLSSAREPGLEPGYKAVEVSRPAIYSDSKAIAVKYPAPARPSFALQAAQLERQNFIIKYANGSIHGEPLLDGGTVLLRQGEVDTPTRVAMMQKGDMEGIAPGYALVTPPQKQPTERMAVMGWS